MRARDVLIVLVRSDFGVRYGRGGLRGLRWLLDPLAAFGVYLVLVAVVLGRGSSTTALSIACAIVPFQLVMATAANALRAVELRRAIIVNRAFPRELIPPASALTETIGFAAALPLVALLWIADGTAAPATLWIVPAIGVTFAFALALAFPAALFGVWFPELMPFAVSAVRALFFLAPGLVALDEVTGSGRDLLPLNPLTGLFETWRAALVEGAAPEPWMLLVPLGVAAALLALVVPLYLREQRDFAKIVTGGG